MARQAWDTLGGVPDTGGDQILQPGQANQQMFQSLQAWAPQALQSINQGLPQTASAQLAAQQAVQPGYDQLGQQNVTNADAYQKQVDPEFYSQRANINSALNKYLSSYDPNNLTPTELAQITRGINNTTGPITDSAQNTIKNAQTFGAAGTQRWQNFGNAVQQAAGILPTLKSGINGFQVANTGAGATAANQAANNSLNANFGFSTSALGDIAGNTQAQLQKAKDQMDKIKTTSPSSILGGII